MMEMWNKMLDKRTHDLFQRILDEDKYKFELIVPCQNSDLEAYRDLYKFWGEVYDGSLNDIHPGVEKFEGYVFGGVTKRVFEYSLYYNNNLFTTITGTWFPENGISYTCDGQVFHSVKEEVKYFKGRKCSIVNVNPFFLLNVSCVVEKYSKKL